MAACHEVIIVILRVLGEQLGLAPEVLPDLHKIDRTGGDQARVTFAPPVSADTITLGEHTGTIVTPPLGSQLHTNRRQCCIDFGSVTVLFNQLGGLQVINPESYEWKYVKPEPGCMSSSLLTLYFYQGITNHTTFMTGAIINLGDALVKLVGNRLYSGVHRVVGPPGAQAQSPRHSVVYFSRPNGDVKLQSLFQSDDDQEAIGNEAEGAKGKQNNGAGDEPAEEEVLTADEWIAQRARLRRTANFKGVETFNASRGTEHLKGRGKATIEQQQRAPLNQVRDV